MLVLGVAAIFVFPLFPRLVGAIGSYAIAALGLATMLASVIAIVTSRKDPGSRRLQNAGIAIGAAAALLGYLYLVPTFA
jgi:hypothetical protein